jgi:hypothetical protein
MPAQDFFARMRPEFVEQEGSARVNAERQAQVERLIGKAEYEFGKMRRDLETLLALAAGPQLAAALASTDAVPASAEAARAA